MGREILQNPPGRTSSAKGHSALLEKLACSGKAEKKRKGDPDGTRPSLRKGRKGVYPGRLLSIWRHGRRGGVLKGGGVPYCGNS